MSNGQHWLCHWLLGAAFIAMFCIANVAFMQRDEAQRLAKPSIEMRGTTLVVSCPTPATPTAASQVPRQERFVL